MHSNRTLVPIGANFQAVLPPMLTESHYRAKSAQQLYNLKIMKINDPV